MARIDTASVLGQIEAEFRDAEARLKGLGIQKEAMEAAMAETRAKWQEESDSFATRKAAFEAEIKKASDTHAAGVAQREESIVKLVERAQDRANQIINEAKQEIKKRASDAQANLDDLLARGHAASRELATITIEIEEKSGVLGDINGRLASIAKQVGG